jgi:hypothetical protein
MEQAGEDTVMLEAAGPVLARNETVQELLRRSFNTSDVVDALDMLSSGALNGDLGAEVHDLLVDAIENDSRTVWTGAIPGSEFDFPVHVQTFGGVFYVWALEYDKVGYFLSTSAAVDFIKSNWELVEEREVGGR